jgi:hypothetical protein
MSKRIKTSKVNAGMMLSAVNWLDFRVAESQGSCPTRDETKK